MLRELDLGETVRVGFGGTLSQPVERAIIRGSTYLHKHFNFDDANKTLDSIDAPMAIVGLGAQNPTQDASYLDGNEGARDFIARLNEKSASISVRGDFTAAVVERLGGKNIRVTGCPSLFYTLSAPQVRVPEMLAMPERSVGVSIHSGLSANIFCHAPHEARAMHGRVIAWALENAANLSVFEQGVLREYDIADHDLPFDERRQAASEVIARMKAEELFSPERLMAHMVSVKSIEEWLAKARDLDAILGFRFHGNMVALLQGKPCYYYVYDSRLTEFCDVYGLPYQDVTEDWRDPAQAMIDHDWDGANARIAACFDEMKAFYSENGFAARFA
ncbi:polysaccharide pyruvyl transferase family protein [[Roseibacterium] beibuensis]|uniref:polysaccharide pyruvyl transferase family protein n=1 Tax=[Roseibacterium] beibuensis TaxID=1193142 RepID=UPI003CD07499